MAKKNKHITDFEILKIKTELKSVDSKWVEKIVDRIKTEHKKGEFSKVNATKIYNIVLLRTTNVMWRVLFYRHAKKMLSDIAREVESAK